MDEARIQGMMVEFEAQRSLLATRAVQLAGELAIKGKECEDLKKEIEELKKAKKDESINE